MARVEEIEAYFQNVGLKAMLMADTVRCQEFLPLENNTVSEACRLTQEALLVEIDQFS